MSEEDYERTGPPGHVERRQVSNAILAFQIATLQESQTAQNTLLRELIKEGFADVRKTLDAHTEQINAIKVAQAEQSARTAALEQFRAEIEDRERKVAEQTVIQLQAARGGADDARMFRLLAAIAVAILTLAIGFLSLHGG